MSRTRVRALSLMAVVLAMFAVAAPSVDALIFGLHDHVAGTATPAGSQGLSAARAAHSATPHHCELSANPAERAESSIIPRPMLFAVALAEPFLPAPSYTPFAPLTPPRA